VTTKEGVFSPWKGQSPLKEAPAFLSWTVSPMTSTRSTLSLTVAAMPAVVPVYPLVLLVRWLPAPFPRQVPDTLRAVSSLDTASRRYILLPKRRLVKTLSIPTGSILACRDRS